SILLRTCHGLRNKIHAVHAVRYVWVQALVAVHLLVTRPRYHVVIGRSVHIRKCFQKSLGMSARQPTRHSSMLGHERSVWIARVQAVWLTVNTEEHSVRLFLVPFEGTFGAVHFDPKIVLPSMGDL